MSPRSATARAALALVPLLLTALAGCGDDDPPDAPAEGRTGGRSSDWRYEREFLFVGAREGAPLAVPFAFRAWQQRGGIEREARAWLAHAETWDPFLEEEWTSSGESGVWRVLPRGELRIAAASDELEWLRYEEGERRLRLELGAPLSTWQGHDRARYRIQRGELRLGSQRVPGVVLQELDTHRAGADRASDRLFLGNDSLQLVVVRLPGSAPPGGRGWAWLVEAEGERVGAQAEVEWREVMTFEEARRDVPLRWRFHIPEAGIRGEVRSLGYHAEVGGEEGGRRAVEIRHTVEGWIESAGAGTREQVSGVVRHTQG